MSEGRVAVISGASSGIGLATARQLTEAGFQAVVGARRTDRLAPLEALGAVALPLDVNDPRSMDAFVAAVRERFGRIDVLVNNAGLARGKTPVEDTSDEDWRDMFETNVLALLRMTRECLPLLRAAPHAHIVNLGSIAGFETYHGGAGYTATKHAVRAITDTLRIELNGEPIRVTEIEPGMVETEFSVVRFKGDRTTADAVYAGLTPLTAEDIAEVITFCVTRPKHVDIDEVVIRPVAQANSFVVARNKGL